MRTRIVLVACVFLFTPLFLTHAAEEAATEPPKPVHEGENDQCLVEKVSVKEGKVATETGSKEAADYRQCKEANAGSGCTEALEKAGQCKCGTVTYTVTLDGKPCTISKCDSAYKEKVKKCAGGSNLAAQDLAMRELTSEAININTPNDRLQGILEAFGEPTADARAAVTNNKSGVVDFLQKVASGDTIGAQEAAKGLGLNSNLYTDIKSLSAADIYEKFSPALSPAQEEIAQQILSNPDTFNVTRGSTAGQPALQGIVTPFCSNQFVRSCGVACSQVNTLTCRTNNPGAIISSNVMRSVGCVSCGQTNNTACCSSMEQGVAGMYKLITGSGYIGGSNNTIFKVVCKWAEANCVNYGRAIAQAVGISPFQTIDPNDTATVGKLMMAMSRWEHGRGTIFTPEQLQAGIQIALGERPIPAGTPGYVSQYSPGGSPAGLGSPFANVSMFNSGPTGASGPTGSPLGSIFQSGGSSPRPSVPSGGAPSTPTQPVQGGGTPTTPVQGGTTPTSPGQELEDALKSTSQTPQTTEPVQAVAVIIAQPSGITRGKVIIVSWSSVGTNPAVPCTVTLQSGTTTSVIAQGNEGTRTIETSTTSASGAWNFVLKCTTATNGTAIERATSVPVE